MSGGQKKAPVEMPKLPEAVPEPAEDPGSVLDGLGGLIDQFQKKGLGDVIDSWVNRGTNKRRGAGSGVGRARRRRRQ